MIQELPYRYYHLQGKKEIRDLAEKLAGECWYTSSFDFLLSKDTEIYGYFEYYDNLGELKYLFVFGKTVTLDELTTPSKNAIFAKLRQYGSSKRYKGLLNMKGEIIVPNIYDEILSFPYERFLVSKNHKVGAIDSNGNLLAKVVYDFIEDAGEYTVKFGQNGLIGFMDLNFKIVIEPQFLKCTEKFSNGVCSVEKNIDRDKYLVQIDHYGNIVGNYLLLEEGKKDNQYYDDSSSPFPCGQGEIDDYSDPSDAFDGHSDAYWNID